MNIENRLRQLKSRFEELATAMGDPAFYADPRRAADLTREHADLKDVVAAYDRWKSVSADLAGTLELAAGDDPEMAAFAREEAGRLKEEAAALEAELKLLIVPPDPEDQRNAIVEIRAGTGGDEAALFAADLYEMYRRHADEQGWVLEPLSVSESDLGGFKEVVFGLAGREVFGRMKFESGVHRVQRVPATEAQGRIHTSAATVAVLPEAEEVDITIHPADLEVDTFRATGAGGQHINKTDSAIRIRHIPTGTVVECQEERSQHKNRDKAMKMLRTRLYEAEYAKRAAARAAERKSQVSTGDRSAKIRTYNFPQGRLTDHRIGLTLYNLDEIMKGRLGPVTDALRLAENLEKLATLA